MSKSMPARAIGALSGFAPRRLGEWRANLPGNRYSRRVALLKLALPAIGGTLLLMVVAWPRLAPLFDRMRLSAIDLREARELRMVNPRYAGTDRTGRPFIVTAALGRQVPGRDDVVSLEGAHADLKSHSGANIAVGANSGVYQTHAQLLDLFGNVTVEHENGTKFVTASARLDAANNAGEGHEHIEGHGPQGDLSADGFRLIDKGEVIIFTGHVDLKLKAAPQQSSAKTEPAAVPAPVAQAAAQVEATAAPELAEMAAKHAAAKPKAAAHHAAKAPPHHKPATRKTG